MPGKLDSFRLSLNSSSGRRRSLRKRRRRWHRGTCSIATIQGSRPRRGRMWEGARVGGGLRCTGHAIRMHLLVLLRQGYASTVV